MSRCSEERSYENKISINFITIGAVQTAISFLLSMGPKRK